METNTLITVSGDDYERGRQSGEKLKYHIRVNLLNQIRHYKESQGYDFKLWLKSCQNYI